MYRRIKIKRLISLLAVVLVVAGGFTGLRKAIRVNSLSTRPLQIAVVEPLEKLEPALLENHSERLAASAIYEGLVTYDDKEGEIKPLLADKWEYTDEGKSMIVKLRKGLKFSNGREVTANAVKSSWENNISSTREWSNQCMYLRIEGTDAFINGNSNDIAGIQVPDEHTLKIALARVDAAFIYALTNPIFWVIDFSDGAPSGTGPFIIKEQTANNLLLLGNDQYHDGKPNLPAINFICYPEANQALAAYKEGKLDYLDSIPLSELAGIASDPQYQGLLIEQPLMEVYWLGFNLGREPYSDNYLLRRALNYAIDRDAIIKNILGGSYLPVKGVIPAGCAGFNEQMIGYTYNPDKARQLLSDAGYPEGKGLKTLTLTYNLDPGHRQIALEIARQLGLLGITMQVQENDWDYYMKQLTYKQLSCFRLGWQADYDDPDNLLYILFHGTSAQGSNLTGYYNPQVDKILDDSRAEYRDEEARFSLLRRAEEIIVDDAPCLWLFQKKTTILLGKDVRNFQVDSMGTIDWHELGVASS